MARDEQMESIRLRVDSFMSARGRKKREALITELLGKHRAASL